MGVKVRSDMNKWVSDSFRTIERLIFDNLVYVGEAAIRMVRDRSGDESWYDQTGNLRSSVGYVVVKDGQVVKRSSFSTVLNGTEGSSTGASFAESLAINYPQGYALILVAGMEYASYVEDMDNKDVLASAEIEAKALAQELLDKIKL